MSESRKVIIQKKAERPKPHRRYLMFNNLKSATVELAREIFEDQKENAPADVKRFVHEFGRKAT